MTGQSKRILFFSCICGLLVFLGISAAPLWAADFTPGQKVVVSAKANEAPYFESLEKAKEGKDELNWFQAPQELLSRRSHNDTYEVVEQQDKWLKIRLDDEEVWVAADKMVEVGAFLADPANKEVVACPAEMPVRFVVDLDPEHKQAVIKVKTEPSLTGGEGYLEVWNADESKLIWSSAKKPGSSEESPYPVECIRFAPTWPKIVGDANGDGLAEIIFLASPAIFLPGDFFIYKWNGKGFERVDNNPALLIKGTDIPKTAALTRSDQGPTDPPYVYVNGLNSMDKNGLINADFFASEEGKPDRTGQGNFRFNKDFTKITFEGWVKPLEPLPQE